MKLTMTNQINSDLIIRMSVPLYYLMRCYEEQYQQLQQNLINEQTNAMVAQRLVSVFGELTTGVQFNAERVDMLKFQDNFNKFIVNVQGFLAAE